MRYANPDIEELWKTLGATPDVIENAVNAHIADCHKTYAKEIEGPSDRVKARKLAQENAATEGTPRTEGTPDTDSPLMRKWRGFQNAVAQRARMANLAVTKGVAHVKQGASRIFRQSRLEPTLEAAKLPLLLKAPRPALAPSFKKMPTVVEMEKSGI
ncbi:MAG: hypothetical protein M1826_004762 [Phylliscum demangeonii]|nr:MAG: hypothetical protein M1826_004762 [Phylliscum demangeonii]